MSVIMPVNLLPYLKQSTDDTPVDVKTYKSPGKEEIGVESVVVPRGPGEFQLEAVLEALGPVRHFDAEDGPWFAGGAVRRLYEGKALDQGDIDIFLKSYDQFKLLKAALDGHEVVFETRQAISYKIEGLKVQIIKRRYYNNMVDLMNDFDFSVTQFVSDGKRIFTSEQARTDHASKTLRYSMYGRVEEHSMLKRLVKYENYGFQPDYGMVTTCMQQALDYSSHVFVIGGLTVQQDSNYGSEPELSCDNEERKAVRNEWTANAAYNVAERMRWFK